MRLAEARLERDALNTRLETLEARLRRDDTLARRKTQLLEEIDSAASQIRDLSIAIDYTEINNNLLQLPISGHRHKIEANLLLSRVFEITDPDKADELWRSAIDDLKVVEAATWLIDLQIPGLNKKIDETPKEE